MKLLAALTFALMTNLAMASDVTFSCEMNSDIVYKNQFSLKAITLDSAEGPFENLELEFTLRRAGNNSEMESLTLTRDGMFSAFPAGMFAKDSTYSVVSVVKNDPVEYIGLFVDFAGFFHGQLRLVDGTTFFSTCKSL